MAENKEAQKNNDIEREAIAQVKGEITAWENAEAFVTERVSFNMRNLIRQARKNYHGIFDTPKDETTGRQKIWVPMTEFFVEQTVKNCDLDQKDLNFRSKNGDSWQLAKLVRHIVKNELDRTFFGEDLDEFETRLAIDGTAVWKTVEGIDEETGRKRAVRIPLDLLNAYLDPVSHSIQEAYRFTERILMNPDEPAQHKDWINTQGMKGVLGLSQNETTGKISGGTTKQIDIYETYGKYPKYLMTGDEADRDIDADLHIVVSGLNKSGTERLHLIEKYDGKKPYEEAWLKRVPGRWYGKGIPEKLLWLQLWANMIVNIRINRSLVSQLGIFKIKRGAGITPQMVGRLASNGAILVNSMDDIEQFVMQEASQASYKDEDVIFSWAQRITNAFEVVTGESLPSSTPATNAAIQTRNAQSAFVLIKEGLGFFLQRWVKRQFMPITMKNLKPADIIRCTHDPADLRVFDEQIVNELIYQALESTNQQKMYIDPMQVEQERQRALQTLQSMGNDRYVQLMQKIDPFAYDVEVAITNETMDQAVVTNNLMTALQLAPEYKDQILQQAFDLMGLNFKQQTPPMMQQPQQGVPQPQQPFNPKEQGVPQNIQNIVTQANTQPYATS